MSPKGSGIDIAADREFLDQAQILPEGSDLHPPPSRQCSDRLASPLNQTLIGLQAAIGEAQQRRLAGSTGSEQRDAFSDGNAQVERFEATPNADLMQRQLSGQRILPSSRPTVSILT